MGFDGVSRVTSERPMEYVDARNYKPFAARELVPLYTAYHVAIQGDYADDRDTVFMEGRTHQGNRFASGTVVHRFMKYVGGYYVKGRSYY